MKRFHKGCTGTLILRLVIGAVFLYHGITKLMMPAAGMMDFVGGAATNLGLTFFSNETWFWIVAIAETVGGAMIVLGLCTRWAAGILAIVMLFAINTKGWSIRTSELDMVILIGTHNNINTSLLYDNMVIFLYKKISFLRMRSLRENY